MTAGPAMDFDAFWAFSLDRYGREGVSPLCLDVQDRCGADVNIVLWCLFAAQGGMALTGAEIDAVVAGEAGEWHRSVVVPLRAARRAMKAPPAAIDAGRVEASRKRLKAIELESERMEQALLFAALPRQSPAESPASAVDVETRRSMARDALAAYLDTIGAAADAQVDALVRICID